MAKCPICGGEFKSEPFKTWKFRFYTLKRYQCNLCNAKFNLYESDKSVFTIPKARG
ncbi:MAG: hypothetical protein QW220_06600 [Candidatus Bathyarchaeia archaeon]